MSSRDIVFAGLCSLPGTCDTEGRPRIRVLFLWVAILAAAAALRAWPLLQSHGLIWHPDEYRYVTQPLGFFSGDLNPHFFSYPTLSYYLVGLLHGVLFAGQALFGVGRSLEQFVIYHYLWAQEPLLSATRWAVFFPSVATCVAAGALAMRLTTSASAGLFAAALLAISSLHVRQSPLVSPDVSVGLVYAIAVWFALRLLDRESLGAYLWAGLLVGLAAATKYPGALAGGAVLAAHLLAHRSFRDRRLWLAGVASVVVLICTSPYVILDPYTFLSDFSYEVSHMSEGRGNAQTTWWYHLSVGLRHGLGFPA